MLAWLFGSKPACPIDPPVREWVETRWLWLCDQFGRDHLRNAHVVLPDEVHFPDPYDPRDTRTHRVLFDRVCQYVGLTSALFRLGVYTTNPDPWYSFAVYRPDFDGSAGVYERVSVGCTIWVEERQLDDPLRLVATYTHELGHAHLLGQNRLTGAEEDHEPLTDLLSVFLGLGVIAANAVVKEIAWTQGPESGWSASRQGYLDMRTFGYALGLFARMRSEPDAAWRSALRPDVKDATKKTLRLLAAENDPRFTPLPR